jgi:hypothetical protein
MTATVAAVSEKRANVARLPAEWISPDTDMDGILA